MTRLHLGPSATVPLTCSGRRQYVLMSHVRSAASAGAQIWFKREELAHTGAHKINNAVGQALLAVKLGKKRIIAETGAGQHGVATAAACALLDLECIVYMGAVDCERQKLNCFRMTEMGAKVVPVQSGSRTLKVRPRHAHGALTPRS